MPHHIVHDPAGIAEAILRGDPTRAYPHVRRVVAESGGTFAVVSEAEIREAQAMLLAFEGIEVCPASAAAVGGLAQLARSGFVSPDETVLVNLTGRERTEGSPAGRTYLLERTAAGTWTGYDTAVDADRLVALGLPA